MKKNKIRRSQLISPWGVGAIVPCQDGSSQMIAGLDKWRFSKDNVCPERYIVKDQRLSKRLGEKELRLPPEQSENNDSYSYIPTVRFPQWYYCSFCGTMIKLNFFHKNITLCSNLHIWKTGRTCNINKNKGGKLIPERFIVICEDGHIDDFPLMEWLHEGEPDKTEKHIIRRTTGSISSSLSGVKYECSCGKKRSLSGVTKKGALDEYYTCKATRPWLGDKGSNSCGKSVHVVQRGGSNVWFPKVVSSLFIPMEFADNDEKIANLINYEWDKLVSNYNDGKVDKNRINYIAEINKIDPEKLYNAVISKLEEDRANPVNELTTEEEYRFYEYKKLITNSGGDKLEFYCKNIKIEKYDKLLHEYFKSISLVYKLRETRAFTGFSRLLPYAKINYDLSKKYVNWLPVSVIYGEGIFIQFDEEALDKWASRIVVNERIRQINKNLNMFTSNNEPKNINAKYILLHTFAHLLINQLSYESGYSSSSIREKIYCCFDNEQYQMYGVLIYTASGDSEGSLGGLVRVGKPGYIENIIKAAIENARWCSADPICIESTGQGPNSLNLAACHNCAILPETSCERNNTFLDRALVIGTLENPDIGYFNTMKVD